MSKIPTMTSNGLGAMRLTSQAPSGAATIAADQQADGRHGEAAQPSAAMKVARTSG